MLIIIIILLQKQRSCPFPHIDILKVMCLSYQ